MEKRKFKNMLLTFAAIGAMLTFTSCSKNKAEESKKTTELKETAVELNKTEVARAQDVPTHASGGGFLYNGKCVLLPEFTETRAQYEARLQYLNSCMKAAGSYELTTIIDHDAKDAYAAMKREQRGNYNPLFDCFYQWSSVQLSGIPCAKDITPAALAHQIAEELKIYEDRHIR